MKQRYGSREGDLRAAIGPGIRACCYRVGEEVRAEFEGQFPYAPQLFAACKEPSPLQKKYPRLFQHKPGSATGQQAYLDFVLVNVRQLRDAGIAARHIDSDAPCTSCHPEWFFSHRRDGGHTGRMMGVVGIREK